MTMPCGHTQAEHDAQAEAIRIKARGDLCAYIEDALSRYAMFWAPTVVLVAEMLACAEPADKDRDYFTDRAKALSVDSAVAAAVIAAHCIERGYLEETSVLRQSVELGSISAGAVVLAVRQYLISDAITDDKLALLLSTLHRADYPALINLAANACATIGIEWAEMDRLARLATKLSAEQTASGATGTGDPAPPTEEESMLDANEQYPEMPPETSDNPLAQEGFPLAAMTEDAAEAAERNATADPDSGAPEATEAEAEELPSGTTDDGREVAVTHTDDGPAETRTPAPEPYL